MKAKTPPDPTARDRLEHKISVFGDDALLEIDELAALFGVKMTVVREIAAGIAVVQLRPRVQRWRYGTVRKHLADREQSVA